MVSDFFLSAVYIDADVFLPRFFKLTHYINVYSWVHQDINHQWHLVVAFKNWKKGGKITQSYIFIWSHAVFTDSRLVWKPPKQAMFKASIWARKTTVWVSPVYSPGHSLVTVRQVSTEFQLRNMKRWRVWSGLLIKLNSTKGQTGSP